MTLMLSFVLRNPDSMTKRKVQQDTIGSNDKDIIMPSLCLVFQWRFVDRGRKIDGE